MSRSLTEIFLASTRDHANRTAIVHEGGSVSYGELADAVERLAARLQELGAGGTRVGIMLPNVALFPLVFFGAQRAGCSTLLLNPANSKREVTEYLAAAAVSTVLTAEPLAPLLPHGTTALLVEGLPGSIRVADGGDPRDVALASAPLVQDLGRGGADEACVLFTAAERGWGRGAVLSHDNLIANVASTREAMRITPDDCVVGALPYIHLFGLTVTLNTPLAAGASILPVERFRPQRMLADLESGPATVFAGVPAMYHGLLSAAERREPPRHSLRLALSGGAPLTMEMALRWQEVFGLELRQGYGLTEAGPVCLFNRVDRPNRTGSLGVPFPGVAVSVRGPDGGELPDGEVGELCVSGPNVFGGYLGEDGRDPAGFFGEWLRTGDLATRDAEGVFHFHGMLKPMFTRNGFNVYPRELERVLESEPDVERATVLALPDPQRENEFVLQVKLAKGSTLEAEGVREICRARLAAYKQPSRVEVS